MAAQYTLGIFSLATLWTAVDSLAPCGLRHMSGVLSVLSVMAIVQSMQAELRAIIFEPLSCFARDTLVPNRDWQQLQKESPPMKFADLGLAEPLQRAIQAVGYDSATPIQAQAIPVVLAGRDLIGCAQTGTGKTAAFTLPMLDRLLRSAPPKSENENSSGKHRGRGKHDGRNLRALVLSPTRELAVQIGDSLRRYGRFTSLRHAVVVGGVSQYNQVKALQQGVDILVATPGRLIDLMQQGHIDLSHVEVLVLDEADQMLDMGFLPSLKRIIAAVPRQRQTLLFSATMPEEVRQLAQQWLNKPAAIEVAPVGTPASRIAQSVHLIDKKRKPDLLTHFLFATPTVRTLVFSRTKHGADSIVRRLTKDGIYAVAIHGNKSQAARTRTLEQFKSKRPPVLVATDVAARGLDINGVSHVVNYDLPEVPEMYVHRIGRTGRAGATGVAVSFCAGDERGLLRQIERLTRHTINIEPVIDGFETKETNAGPKSEHKSEQFQKNGHHRGPARSASKRPHRAASKSGAAGPAGYPAARATAGSPKPSTFKKRKPRRRRARVASAV